VDESVRRTVTNAIQVFLELGATVVDVTVPDVKQAVIDWSPACAVEASLAHEATYPQRKNEYGPILASVLDAGRALPATEFEKIFLRRTELRRRFAELFLQIDILLLPVQPFAPLSLDTVRTLGEQPELILKLQRYTAPFDMTGDPTITLPGGFNEAGLPIGIQLAAGHLRELQLVHAARAFQKVTTWHRRHPDACRSGLENFHAPSPFSGAS
jgi:amidase